MSTEIQVDERHPMLEALVDADNEAERLQIRRKALWLQIFAEKGIIQVACDATRVARRTVRAWQAADKLFAELFCEAEEAAADRLEAEAHRRAFEGVEEPVTYQGMPTFVEDPVTGEKRMFTVNKKSDQLMTLMLTAAKPEKYRTNIKSQVDVNAPQGVILVPSGVAPTDWAAAAADAQAKYAGSTGEDS